MQDAVQRCKRGMEIANQGLMSAIKLSILMLTKQMLGLLEPE